MDDGNTAPPKWVNGLAVLYGLFFATMGLNHFFNFFEIASVGEATNPDAHAKFWTGIGASGFMMTLIFATEAASGILILSMRFTALGLILLTPVLVHIVGYHLWVDRDGLEMAIVFSAVHLVLAWMNRQKYRSLFC